MPGQRAQRHQQDDEDDDEADQPPPGPVAPARRGVSSQVAGDAHEGSLTSAHPAPMAQAGRRGGQKVLLSRSPARSGSGSPSAPAGGRARWGTSRTPPTAPASALSSQSEQPPADVTTQRTLPSAPGRAATPAEKACVAWSPTRRSTRSPRHSRKAAPTRSRRLAGPVGDPAAQHRHHRPGQPGRGLLHGVAPADGRRPGSDEHRPGGERLVRGGPAPRRRRPPGARPRSPSSVVGVELRRAAQQVEQPVLVVAQRALDRPAQPRRDRREQLVAPADDRVVGTGRHRPPRSSAPPASRSARSAVSASAVAVASPAAGAVRCRQLRRPGLGRRPGPDPGEELVDRGRGRRSTRPASSAPTSRVGRSSAAVGASALVRRVLIVRPLGPCEADLVGHAPARRPAPRRRCGRSWPRIPSTWSRTPVHRRRHLVAGRAQLLDLDAQRTAPRAPGRPAPGGAPLAPARGARGPRPWRGRSIGLALGRRPRPGCARCSRPGLLLGVGHQQLHLDRPARPTTPRCAPAARRPGSASRAAAWPPPPGPGRRSGPPPRGRGAGSGRCAGPATPSGWPRRPPGGRPAPRPRPGRPAAPARCSSSASRLRDTDCR